MATKNTFKNIARVTENYDGKWMGTGWYAFRFTITSTPRDEFGGTGYEEHIGIEYLMHECDMEEETEYTDFIGDYSVAIAEYVGSGIDYIHFGELDEIEDSYVAETVKGLADEGYPEDELESIARDFYEENCIEFNLDGKVGYMIVPVERCIATFGEWDADATC